MDRALLYIVNEHIIIKILKSKEQAVLQPPYYESMVFIVCKLYKKDPVLIFQQKLVIRIKKKYQYETCEKVSFFLKTIFESYWKDPQQDLELS